MPLGYVCRVSFEPPSRKRFWTAHAPSSSHLNALLWEDLKAPRREGSARGLKEGRKEELQGYKGMIISLCSMESRVPFSAEMWWLDNWGVGGGWGWREQRRRLREIVTHLFTFGFLSHLRRLPKVPTPLTPDDLTRRCGSDNLLNYFLSRDFIGPASISALLGQVSFSTVKKRHGVFLFLLLFFPFTLSNDSILRRSRCDGNWFMSPF